MASFNDILSRTRQGLLLGVAFVVLIAIAGSVTWLVEQSTDDAALVAHTLRVQDTLSDVLLNVRRGESAQRGYLFTQQRRYLEDFNETRPDVDRHLAELRALVQDNLARLSEVNQMTTLIEAKFAEMINTINLNKAGKREEAASSDVKSALADATGRVHAVAQLHRRLYTSDDVQQVAVDQYLSALLEDLRRSADSDRAAQVTLDADPVDTHTDGAVAIGVIVNELVMNAIKYAYPDGAGPIRVILKNLGPDSAIVCVEDDGIGFKETDNPTSTGLGQRIVKAMASKVNGEISHEQKTPGTRVSVSFSRARQGAKSPHSDAPGAAAS